MSGYEELMTAKDDSQSEWKVAWTNVCKDPGACCEGFQCPADVQSHAVHRVTNSGTFKPWLIGTFLCCVGRYINRVMIMKAVGIKQNWAYDCFLVLCCPCCETIQEYNEVFVRYPP